MTEAKDPDETGEAQEVDPGDADVTATPSQAPPEERRRTGPPPLPPSASLPPNTASAGASHPPSASPLQTSMPPEPAGRTPAFYGVVLLVLLVVGVAGGALVAFTKSKRAPAPGAAASASGAGQNTKVINIPVVDMNDEDGGAP